MSKLRIGLIVQDLCKIFIWQHLEKYLLLTLVAVGILYQEKAKKFADKWKIPNYFSGDDAFKKYAH
jgi:predicted dehydrogenase